MKKIRGWVLPEQDQHISEYLDAANSDIYQPVHQKTSISFCNNFRTAIDIGAHVGLWARGLTEKFNNVICFEPCADFIPYLVENAPKAKIFNNALGEKEDTVKINMLNENTGASHIVRGATGDIPVLTLDSFNFNDVDFIKIDVEGYEYEVVKGGYETLKRNHPVIIVEQKAKYVVPEQGALAAVRFLIQQLNYRVMGRVVDDWILRK